jgi:hypothetical protein
MANLQQFSSTTLLLSMVFILLSGCELTPKQNKSSTSYGEYYLTLQQLSKQQLTEEVSKQQTNVEYQTTTNIENKPKTNVENMTRTNTLINDDAQIKLLLLYSMPKSPIYSSFKAKALLNQLKSEADNTVFADLTPSEQAFFSLLRDQLNQQLLMRNRLLAQQKEQQKKLQLRAIKQQKQAVEQQEKLIEQVKLLEQTIKQLKSIEQAIDKRDQ